MPRDDVSLFPNAGRTGAPPDHTSTLPGRLDMFLEYRTGASRYGEEEAHNNVWLPTCFR
jgi:hypothetical protein